MNSQVQYTATPPSYSPPQSTPYPTGGAAPTPYPPPGQTPYQHQQYPPPAQYPPPQDKQYPPGTGYPPQSGYETLQLSLIHI